MRPAVLLMAALCAHAGSALAAGDPAAGQQKAAMCQGCHGAKGVSSMAGVPSLAGQRDQFLQWQLVFFRSGRRDNPIMTPLTANMSDQDVRDLGAYFASLPPPPAIAADPDPALHATGATLAEQHHCAACHTDNYVGKQAAARVAGQREDYLVHALADYRSSARPSTGVAAMTEAASGLSDEDIAALAHFLATLPDAPS
jgi:cytochrome c553